ncbi:MAG: endolytic transglycosylase MltG [Bdellovibrionales bacterium]|nr:endolytic transglycosylase MltG [Bdellovibrionales bacterium]
MKTLVSVIVLVVLSAFLILGWQGISFVTIPPGNGSKVMDFEVTPGESFTKIAKRLEQKGLVKNATYLKVFSKLRGVTQEIRIGEYELNDGMTPTEVLKILGSGKSKLKSFTIPEGQNIYEIAQILADKGYGTYEENLANFKDKELIQSLLGKELPSLEGYLFPETYNVTKYTTPREIAQIMVERFQAVWNELSWDGAKMSQHELVTLASIVEKETGAPEERPRIASVFHNRLRKGMRLQSDPTIIYGIAAETGKIIKNIRKKDIKGKTPYNTYTIKALPVGPISNPGREALKAVLNPDGSPYLYFVSRNDGTHVFSKTLQEHNAAVREFQLRRSARKGKSWRDLQKRRTN